MNTATKSAYNFNPELERTFCVTWIRDLFNNVFKGKNAVIGMSGGKDSTIAAALIAEAIGPDRVIGVAMPDKNQSINDADKICEYLGIKYLRMPIEDITAGFDRMWYHLADDSFKWSEQSKQNIPPRIRMTMLYAVAQTYNGVPVNTCNLSEDYIGYSTIFGDLAGAFSPIKEFTVTELLAIGERMGLPRQWVFKTPDDGLPHSCADEEKFGFSYATLDKYIREGIEPTGFDGNSVKEKIDRMHALNKFKMEIVQIPSYHPYPYSSSSVRFNISNNI